MIVHHLLDQPKSPAMILCNPKFGLHLAQKRCTRLANRLKKQFDPVWIRYTSDLEDIDGFVEEALEKNCHSLFVMGGDGTVSRVFQTMVQLRPNPNDQPIVGIIPTGTFNGLAQQLNLPILPSLAISILPLNRWQYLDLGVCEFRYFALACCIGALPEAIGMTSTQEKQKLGVLAYFKRFCAHAKTEKYHLTVASESGLTTGFFDYLLVCLSGRFATFRFVPNQWIHTENQLHVFLLKHTNFWQKCRLGWHVLWRRVPQDSNIVYIQSKQITIQSKSRIKTNLDGEIGPDLPITLSILPKAVRCYTGQH